MKLNLTTVLLVAIAGYVGWMFYKNNYQASGSGLTSNPNAGKTTTGPQDTMATIAGDVASIINGLSKIAQSSPQTNGNTSTSI